MISGVRRSFSLSGVAPSSPVRSKGGNKSYHIRSISLPCRSHPIISQVEEDIRALKIWQSEAESTSTPSLSAGLALLELLYTSVDDLLRLPQYQDSLRRRSSWTEHLLDDFLCLADAHGTFRSAVMALKEHQSAAQVSIRRCDKASLASCLKAQRNIEKELVKLARSLRNVSRPFAINFSSDVGEAELAGILKEVTLVTVSTSTTIFFGTSSASSSVTSAVVTSSLSTRDSWMVSPLKRLSSGTMKISAKQDETEVWRSSAHQCLEGLEECLEALESKSERLFRSLVNARVSILNTLTL